MVSIIIPIFNTEEFLLECLVSIQRQTYTNFECICFDDGSTDESKKICFDLINLDSRFKYFYQENAGQAIAKNKAIELSVGDLIMIVDSDDILPKNCLELMVDTIVKFDADVVFGQAYRFSKVSEFENKVITPTNIINDKLVNSTSPINDWLDNKLLINPESWGKIFKKKLIDKFQFNSDRRIHDDTPLNPFLLFNSKKVVVLPEIIYYYRLRPGSLMNSDRELNSLNEITSNYLDLHKMAIQYSLPIDKFPFFFKKLGIGFFFTLVDSALKWQNGKARRNFIAISRENWRKFNEKSIFNGIRFENSRRLLIILVLKYPLSNIYRLILKLKIH